MTVQLSAPGPRYSATLQLLRTAESLWNGSRLFFARWDLSPSQFNILNLLHGQPEGRSQIELSRQLIMHRSNVTGLVDRLESRGLVTRRATPGDRRAYQIVLTASGVKLVQAILPYYYYAAEEVWEGLPVKHVQRLVEELKNVSAAAGRMANSRKGPIRESKP